MTKLLILFLLFYVSLLATMYVLQRKLLFLPEKTILMPADYGLEDFSDLTAVTADGTHIQMWYRKAEHGFPTILYFHGNAANIANRAGSYASFASRGFGILALSYRGYGKSQGTPSERGIYQDARAAIQYATQELKIPLDKIMYYGESLGSGVAVQMATEFKPGAIILEAPYTSVADRAAEIYFYIPVHLLIKDHFNSLKKIGSVTSPVLIFHGALDITIPIAHGKALLAAANEPKQGHFFDHIGHNDFDRNVISAHVLDFAKAHGLVKP